jgi:DNA-binding transcriptional ArsR family regulator
MTDKPLAIQAFTPRLLKALGHERRYTIFLRLGERPWTCEELANDLGEDIKRVYEDVGVLAKEGAVEYVGKEASSKGGRQQLRYRATRYTFDAEEWEALPALQKETMSVTISKLLIRELADALASGSFDAHPNRVLVRFPLITDDEGVREVNAITMRAEREVAEVALRSMGRSDAPEWTPVRLVVAFLSFLSPETPSENSE